MREIKLRSWSNNSMAGPFLLKDIPSLTMAQLSHGEDVVIEQFIGLWDKNGKEIYEGDFLKRTQQIDGNWVSRVFEKYEVAYNAAIAGFEYKPTEGKEYKQYTVRPFGGDEIEIIGSIHELNPASGQAGVNHMYDPNQQQQEAGQPAEANAQESASQDQAMGVDSEEGTTEG